MLAIRLQRLGRKGYPVYRLAVQEAQRHPSSGRVIAYVGSYDPHTKKANIQVELAQKYLDNGAQPTPRVVKLLKEAGVKLPSWVKKLDSSKKKAIKNPEKLRKNQPKEKVTDKVDDSETKETDTVVDPSAEKTEEKAEATEEAEK